MKILKVDRWALSLRHLAHTSAVFFVIFYRETQPIFAITLMHAKSNQRWSYLFLHPYGKNSNGMNMEPMSFTAFFPLPHAKKVVHHWLLHISCIFICFNTYISFSHVLHSEQSPQFGLSICISQHIWTVSYILVYYVFGNKIFVIFIVIYSMNRYSTIRYTTLRTRGPFYWHVLTLIPAVTTSIMKCGMKLLVHSQFSTVR